MPPSMPDQQAELRRKARRRLVGAIILVLLLVIFLPMVLDHEPKPISADVPVRLPATAAQDSATPLSQQASVPAPQTPAAGDPEPAPGAAASEVVAAAPADEKATQESAAAASSSTMAAAGGAFVVQVGAFSSAGKAEQAQRKVAAAGLPVFTETVDVGGQPRIRVRAGPFEQRAQAEAALEKLSEVGFGGKLMMK